AVGWGGGPVAPHRREPLARAGRRDAQRAPQARGRRGEGANPAGADRDAVTTAGPGTLGLPERTGRELEALAARLGSTRAASLLEAIRDTGEVELGTRGLLRIQDA